LIFLDDNLPPAYEKMKMNKGFIEKIKGFLHEEEGMALYNMAALASAKGPCLEIGSYCGKSAIYLGSGCKKNNGVLFSIDHHRGSEEQQPGEEYFDPDLFDTENACVDTFREFRKTLEIADLTDTVIPIVSNSDVVARQWATPLSLVFIDGGHSYKAAHADYTSWKCHILPGGYLLIHDIFKDPSKGGQAPYLVYREALESGFFQEHSHIKTLGVLQRKNC
jgi:predicted O-methyltransferase YrrM